MTEREDVASRAARDVARLLDRRGLRELVALARQVRNESTIRPSTHLRPQAAEARYPWMYAPSA